MVTRSLWLFVAMLFSWNASAQTESLAIPSELQSWVPWVLHDLPELYCPTAGGAQHCVWPGDLQISTTPTGATFSLRVHMDIEGLLSLPGDREYWPQDVRIEIQGPRTTTVERPLVVRLSDGTPAIKLGKGPHLVLGRFEWSQAPEVLQIPNSIGRVSLNLGRTAVAHPRMENGRLWLGDGTSEASEGESDSVKATVYRRFSDDVPLRVITRVQLNVAGKAREVALGKVLLPGSVPIRVDSPIPARVPPDGDLSVYVRPGSHLVEIEAVLASSLTSIKAPELAEAVFDPQEVWVWIPNEPVRSVRIEGITGIDPDRTSLPDDWKGHSTFLVSPGQEATFEEQRRGMPAPSPNVLQLQREFWLDLDGEGYTVRDTLSGTINQGWRLNMADGLLGRVSDHSTGQDMLITKDPDGGLFGVEIRGPNVRLGAESRLEHALTQLTIVGWNHDVQSLSASVHLPPGWMLVGGSGVDQMPGTWFESWRLWDFFFVLLVALTVGKLFGWGWFVVALLTLVLSHGYSDAPTWVWVFLLASLALLRVLPEGLIRNGILTLRVVSLIALAIILAPFAQDQLRWAIHPQVAQTNTFAASPGFSLSADEKAMGSYAGAPNMAQEAEMDFLRLEDEGYASKSLTARDQSIVQRKPSKRQELQQIDPNAVVQTGYGVPTWSWSTWSLNWVGPVRKDHVVELYLLPPMFTGALAFLRIGLLILLALLLISLPDMRTRRRGGAAAAGVALVMLVAAPASAEMPVQELSQQMAMSAPSSGVLETLKSRLVAAQRCDGDCVVASRADIMVQDLDFKLRAEVYAQKETAWHLPGPADPVNIRRVLLNGVPTSQLRRDHSGLTMVRLPQGRHIVEVEASLVNRNVATIQFNENTRPRVVAFKSAEWTVDGIGPTGVPDSSIQLTRQSSQEGGDVALASELPPWFQVERVLELGLPWQIRTTITRQDDARPQLVKFPIGSESVITDGVRTESGHALVDFARGNRVVEFISEIPISEEVSLKASEGQPWTETWRVQCSQIWRCSFSDLPRVQDVLGNVYQPMWKPWPGESLVVTIVRPEAAEGRAMTVEDVRYTITPGKRLLQANLTLQIRSSTASSYQITLPPGAELQAVTVDGTKSPIQTRDGIVALPVVPGKRTFSLDWQEPWERQFEERVPPLVLGSDAVNVETTIRLGEDRWLLWVRGPSWGPAILFWSHLIVLLIIALLLGRIPHLPIRTWEWLLLVIGLSQVPVIVGLPIVIWFVLLSYRRRTPPKEWWAYDLLQLSLVGLTFLAAACLYGAVHTNLLFDVDMQVQGARSSNQVLRWYVDQSPTNLEQPVVYSLPILVWRVLMFVWAFWLVWRLISWVKWGWMSFASGGLWRKMPPRPPRPGRPPRSGQAIETTIPGGPDSNASGVEPARARTSTESGGPIPGSGEAPSALSPGRKEHTTLPGTPSPTEEDAGSTGTKKVLRKTLEELPTPKRPKQAEEPEMTPFAPPSSNKTSGEDPPED